MTNSQTMSTIQYPTNLTLRPISLKMFGAAFGISNYKKKKNMYNDYLELSGKKENMTLTTMDLFKIEGVIL